MLRDFLPAVKYLGVLQGIALILFLVFFILLLIRVFKSDKKQMQEIALLPLDQKNPEIKISGGQNE